MPEFTGRFEPANVSRYEGSAPDRVSSEYRQIVTGRAQDASTLVSPGVFGDEPERVVFVLVCGFAQPIEVYLRTLVIEDPLSTLNEGMEGELLADTGQSLGIG